MPNNADAFPSTTVKLSTTLVGLSLALAVIMVLLWGLPQYKVYTARKQGEAALAHASYSKEVAVAEAKAKMESSSLLAQADTIRAHGIARSNQIIGSSLKGNENYLKWLWIDNIDKNPQATIYVPTESNWPLFTESGRIGKRAAQEESDSTSK